VTPAPQAVIAAARADAKRRTLRLGPGRGDLAAVAPAAAAVLSKDTGPHRGPQPEEEPLSAPSRDEALTLLKDLWRESLPERDVPPDDAPLFGAEAQLDSMELVSFVADVEERANERFGADCVLADERALSRSRSPFRSLEALAEYLCELLADA